MGLARRAFLIGSAVVAGGVLFGWRVAAREHDNPLLPLLEPGEASLSPFVRIGPEGVTVIVPRNEVGQGVQSGLARLVAEEMDLEWGDFAIEHGPPAPAYYNAAIGGEGIPFASTDESLTARTLRAGTVVAARVLGLQITGGSSSVPDAFDRMRVAGAVARETLKQAAALRLEVDRADLRTEGGAVVTPDGRRIPYSDLAVEAAALEPVDAESKPPEEWKLIGQPLARPDILAKSTGTYAYGIDMALPGMVHAAVRTNPARTGMASFDAAAARAMPGVRDVVEIEGGLAVIAADTWTAFQAAEALDVAWNPPDYPAEEAAQRAELVRTLEEGASQDSRFLDLGDVEVRLADVERMPLADGGGSVNEGDGATVTAVYSIPYLAHAPLEPMTATALYTGRTLTIWTATQVPGFAVRAAAQVAGLDEDDVTLNVLPAGGSFGRRLEDDWIRQAVQIAVAVPDVPVKLTWRREHDMTHDFPRPMALAAGRAAATRGGIEAFDLDVASSSVFASQMGRAGFPVAGPDTSLVAGAWDQPLAIPHYRVTGHRAPDMVPVSSWRSVGASGNGFFHESLFDEVCRAAGLDPLAERMRLVSDDLSLKTLEAIGELSGWADPLEPDPEGHPRGRGLACILSFGTRCAEVVEVTATPRGIRLDRAFVVAELGTVVDPTGVDAQLSGGMLFGLGHAMHGILTYEGGVPQETNFDLYGSLRYRQTPEVLTRALENGEKVRGVGEPAVPPAAPALANAIFDATGQRIRELPLDRHVDFA